MMRNDYRRALILLRGNAAGYSGHVRLERRTLMGSMYFQVQAPQSCGQLRAALVGRGRDSYYACALGEMTRDGRGQAVMSYSFDPRNICSRELEQYQLLVITCAEDADCEILLYGNVNGHADLNWERVRTALCGLYAEGPARGQDTNSDAPAADLPGEDAEGGGSAEAAPAVAQEASPPTMDTQMREEMAAQAPDTAGEQIGERLRREIEREIREEIQDEIRDDDRESLRQEIQEEIRDDLDDLREDIREFFGRRDVPAAGSVLGVNMDAPWPEDVEPLRGLFRSAPVMENPPDGEYVYIAAPMPEESGYPYCAVGVLVQNGMPVSVRYALPSLWSAEPPAGLEDYAWVGDGNRGWWVSEMEIYPDGAI